MEYENIWKALDEQLKRKDTELEVERLVRAGEAKEAAKRIAELENDVLRLQDAVKDAQWDVKRLYEKCARLENEQCAILRDVANDSARYINAFANECAARIKAADTVADDESEYEKQRDAIIAQDETAVVVEGV